jgi:hypothetical protein
MTRESTPEATAKEARAGKFALMSPVITSVDGRCVATTRWIPVARAIWARRQSVRSTSPGYMVIRSANSSMKTAIKGSGSNSFLRLALRL